MTELQNQGDALLTALLAMANPHRLRILAALSTGSNYVSQLARDIGISRPLMHMHLQKLTDAGLVQSETLVSEDGKAHRYYTVTDFELKLDPDYIAEAVKTLTPSNTGRKEKNNE